MTITNLLTLKIIVIIFDIIDMVVN